MVRRGRFTGTRTVTAFQMQRWVKLGIVLVCGLLYLYLYRTGPSQVPAQYEKWEHAAGVAREKVRQTWNAKGVQDISNSTLGFQEIFVINLPSRTERRDSMALTGAITGLQFSYIDGVPADQVDDRVLPIDSRDKPILPGNKGSWRAHLNALRTIVERNISTALIMEDDIDWDIRLKSQLQSFALASRIYLQPLTGTTTPLSHRYIPRPGTTSTSEDLKPAASRNTVSIHSAPPHTPPTTSPYGDAWDLLWLGHCGTTFPTHPPAADLAAWTGLPAHTGGHPAQLPLLRVTVPSDATVPEPRHLRPHPFALPDVLGEDFAPHTRVVHAASGTTCSLAYAVSQAGARRVLRQMGLRSFTAGYDLMLGAWCDGLYMPRGQGRRGSAAGRPPTCLAVQPPLFAHYLEEGRGSDIQAQGGGYLAHRTGSQYVRWSVRGNMQRLVEGEGEGDGGVVDQWPDE